MLRVGAADKVLANRVLPGKVGYPATIEVAVAYLICDHS
jgi:hypothetical protein